MDITTQTATDLVEVALGQGPWRVEPFGAGKFSHTFRADGPGGSFVLRVAPPDDLLQLFYEYRMMRQEPALHAKLRAETDVPVPEILHYDFTRERIDRDWLVMPRIEGEPLIAARLSPDEADRALEQWGEIVAKTHELIESAGRFGYVGSHRPMDPAESWASAFEEMFRREMRDVAATGIVAEADADEAGALLEENLVRFDNAPEPRLLHGDLWSANLLVDPAGAVTALLDWDRACWGDIEWDLAIAEYCGITRPAFWAGYGRRVETHAHDAAVRRLFYLVYEHFKYVVISVSRRRNDPARAKRYARECLAALENFRRTGRPKF